MTEYTNTPILPEKAKELMSLDTEYKESAIRGWNIQKFSGS